MAFVSALAWMLSSALVTVTCASRTTASLESFMVPVIEARSDWASISPAVSNNTEKSVSPTFMQPSQLPNRGGLTTAKEIPRAPNLDNKPTLVGTDLHFHRPCNFTDVPHERLRTRPSLSRVHANIVHQQPLRKHGGIFRTPGQTATNCQVQDDEKRMVEHPTLARREVRWRLGLVKLLVHIKAYNFRFPLGGEHVKIVANASVRKSKAAGQRMISRIPRAVHAAVDGRRF